MPVPNFFVLIFDAVANQKERVQAVSFSFSFFSIVTKEKIKTRKLAFGFQSPDSTADATRETCFFDTIFG